MGTQAHYYCPVLPPPRLPTEKQLETQTINFSKVNLSDINRATNAREKLENAKCKKTFKKHEQLPVQDVRSLLQLRPKISKPTVPAPPRPATPRQRQSKRDPKPAREPSRPGKKGKGKSKGALPPSQTKAEWCATYKGRSLPTLSDRPLH